MFDTSDRIYLALIDARKTLDDNFAVSCEKARQMENIPGYTSPYGFIVALREEYEHIRAELNVRIERRIAQLSQ
jgi:hypothetical protein